MQRVAAARLRAIAVASSFYRSVQRVNNDARVLSDLWRIKQMLREGRKRRVLAATSEGNSPRSLFPIARLISRTPDLENLW